MSIAILVLSIVYGFLLIAQLFNISETLSGIREELAKQKSSWRPPS